MALDRRAMAEQRGESLADRVERVRYGVYTVPSQSEEGVRWTVLDLDALGSGHGLRCTCKAGMLGRPCAHREAVLIRRQREQGLRKEGTARHAFATH